jgi:pseudouridine kinase
MRAGSIVALGGANLDTVASAATATQRGDSTPGQVRTSAGGVARNVAENLARLGHVVRLVSAVGDDPAGHALLASTRLAGVDVSACAVVPGEATASYVSLHEPDGTLLAAVNDMQVLERLTPAVLAPHAAALQAAALWLLDANLSDAALAWLFAQQHAVRQRHGTAAPVFADAVSAAKCVRLRPWLGRLHTLKLNRLEAQALCGRPTGTPAEVEAAVDWLHDQGVAHVVLSVGAQGLYFSAREPEAIGVDEVEGRGEGHASRGGDRHTARGGERRDEPHAERGWLAAMPAPALLPNTNGAGDALMAGLVHAHLLSAPLAEAARVAAACAALTLTTPAANHPDLSPALVAQWLDSQAEP